MANPAILPRSWTIRSVLVALSGILISFSVSCSSLPAAGGEPQARDSMGRIHFDQAWRKLRNGSERGVNDNVQYVIRQSKGELIFKVKQGFDGTLYGKDVYDFPVRNPDYDYYTDDQFAVSLNGNFRVREATDAEWAAAAKPLHSYRFINSWENPQFTDTGVTYNHHLYGKTGDSWGTHGALVSPNKRWIAVFSFTSPDKPRPALIPGFGGNGPGHGDLFIDIYDLASGDKVISRRAWFGDDGGGVSPSLLMGVSVWIEDRYLIVPLNSYLADCFLMILPEK